MTMTLFEITTGKIGESYVRCYIFAKDQASAEEIFKDAYPAETLEKCRFLFNARDQAFYTSLSSDGFGGIRVVEQDKC